MPSAQGQVRQAIVGKQVGIHTYWHYSLTAAQPPVVQHLVAKAEQIAGLVAGQDFNIIKFAQTENSVSLLHYPGFFDDPFPALSRSWGVDLVTKTVKRRSYAESLNPPILHRKELFLPQDHPRIPEYRTLTESAEQLSLFENSRTIGFRHAWNALIEARGYFLDGHQFLPIGNAANDEGGQHDIVADAEQTVMRHRTALTRYNLSAPMQALARFGFLDGQKSIFDYGCGKGDDVRNLLANQLDAAGWDPHFAPDQPKKTARIVNLGFVINVIENIEERADALAGAFALAEELLVVSAMLYNQNSFKGQQYQDGVLTARNTFQKYYTQGELKSFLDEILSADAIPIGPGIFFVFRDSEAEQRFLLGRQRSRANLLRLTQRSAPEPHISVRDQKYQARLEAIEPLRNRWLLLGRQPHKSEVDDLVELTNSFGSVTKALHFVVNETDADLLARARQNRMNDLLVYFALYTFSRRKPYSRLDATLQLDIKAFFGNYLQALEQGRALLFQLGNSKAIEADCQAAAEQGIGYYDEERALSLPSDQVERLSPLLRTYIGCAVILYGDISQADLIKIHIESGKLSLMRYDNFAGSAIPRLLERVKIKFRMLDFDYFSYGEDYEPTYLYLKSRYLNEDSSNYAEQLEFDEKIQALGLFNFAGYGPRPHVFREKLSAARWEIDGLQLIRSRRIPELDEPCGQHFTYRSLIECGETWQRTGISNLPQQPDSYTALHDLVTNILEPVIDYFGMIRLTYGFCSAALAKEIPGCIAPKLDQHAAYELNRLGNPICPRLGAAVDFIVEDEDMLEVAEWVAENTPLDRLYFYGSDKPIHISYGPEQKGEFVKMRVGSSGRLIPFVRRKV